MGPVYPTEPLAAERGRSRGGPWAREAEKFQLLVRWEVGHVASQSTCARVLKARGRCRESFQGRNCASASSRRLLSTQTPRGQAAWAHLLRGDCAQLTSPPWGHRMVRGPGVQPRSAEQAAVAACGSELWRHQGQEGKWLNARVARAAGGQAGVSRGGAPFSSIYPQGSCSSQCPTGPWRPVLLRWLVPNATGGLLLPGVLSSSMLGPLCSGGKRTDWALRQYWCRVSDLSLMPPFPLDLEKL